MGENNSIMLTFRWKKRISLLGLSLSAVLLTLLFLVVSGAADARSTATTSQPQRTEPEEAELVCPADLISYWRLDETSGTVFSDDIMGLDASCSGSGCPAFATGRVGGALAFDGSNDGLTAPDAPQYDWDGSDSFSIELWVKTAACDGTVFLGKHEFPVNDPSSWWLGCNSSGDRPAFSLRDGSTSEEERIIANSSIGDNAWHHLVAVHDAAADEMRLYVDGTVEITKTRVFADDFNNDNPITFGFHANSYWADATIDEVAVYDAVLTESEIEAHYQKGLSGLDYCNQVPVAKDGSYSTAINVPVSVTLSYDDIDGPGPHTFTIVDGPDHGVLSGSGADRTYTPDPDYTGGDSFTWHVHDGLESSNEATIGILVSATGENDAPVANSQTASTPSNTPLSIELDYTDPDNGPGPYAFTIVDGPDHGTLSGSGQSRTYTPDANYLGSDSFTWQVSDGLADSNMATVTVEVQNQAPVAQSSSYQTTIGAAIDIQLQYTDPDQGPGPHTFTIVDGPAHGALSGSGATRTYTPDDDYMGSDSFTWRVNDGASDSNLATVTIDIEETLEEEQWLYLPLIKVAE